MALNARHYQLKGKMMPNGKGGFMTVRDGYSIAAVSLLMSGGCFLAVYKSWNRKN
jgi:hypothetical protein